MPALTDEASAVLAIVTQPTVIESDALPKPPFVDVKLAVLVYLPQLSFVVLLTTWTCVAVPPASVVGV